VAPGHGHGHDHRSASTRALTWVLALVVGFAAVEAVGGLLTHSLALLADAGHMVSDALSTVLALVAIWLARRPATSRRSFGFQRAEILAAFLNGLTLVGIAVLVFVEAARRLTDPPDVTAGWVLVIAAGGVAINVAAAAILVRSGRESLNVEAAYRHVLADLLGSAGVIAAAIVVLATGSSLADPIVSIAIGGLILWSAWSVLRDSTNVLLETTPPGVDADEVARAIVALPGVESVHDLHIWTITSGFDALSAHVLVGRNEDCHARRRAVERMLLERFHIDHTTLQVEHAADELIQVARSR
jgi:cobalt-zinc-cadmium efflux system protein